MYLNALEKMNYHFRYIGGESPITIKLMGLFTRRKSGQA